MQFIYQIPFIFLFIQAHLLASTSTPHETCEDYIHIYPTYTCVHLESIGEGASGTAFLVQKNSEKYVLKVQKYNHKARTELAFLEKLNTSPFIIKIKKCQHHDDQLVCLLQFGEKGSLFNLIIGNDPYFSSFRSVLTFFKKLLEGVQAIHRHNIVHADLKLENVVVTSDYDPLIIDFDLAVQRGELASFRGTTHYIAPEIHRSHKFHYKPTYKSGVDLYALGVILYSMVKKKFPLKMKNLDYDEMLKSEVIFDAGDYVDFRDLVKSLVCLKKERIHEDELHTKIEQILSKDGFEQLEYKESYRLKVKNDVTVYKEEKPEVTDEAVVRKDSFGKSISKIEKEKKKGSFSYLEIVLISIISFVLITIIGILIWFKQSVRNRITTNSFAQKIIKKPVLSDIEKV